MGFGREDNRTLSRPCLGLTQIDKLGEAQLNPKPLDLGELRDINRILSIVEEPKDLTQVFWFLRVTRRRKTNGRDDFVDQGGATTR